MSDFTKEQIERYSRHIILPEVGGKGQRSICEARVLVLGAGGLGSPAAYYLAAAGVGHLGIVDSDTVDLSNIQRQVLHTTADIGRPKTVSAEEKLRAVNPEIEVRTYQTRLTSENIMDVIRDYEIVVDGTDNFPTRFLVNDACYIAKKPMVHGAILRFEGQLLTMIPDEGPCYRCIFREPPPPGLVPNCRQAGILGAVAGVIGSLQATEVLKLILNKGEPLMGRLLLYDALSARFRVVNTKRDPECPICGKNPSITGLVDYDQACSLGSRCEGEVVGE